MKKSYKILFILIVLLFVVVLGLPFVFQGRIMNIVKHEINKAMNARVNFEDAHLSLIRSFPDFSLRLDRLCIVGMDPFANDTLVYVDNLRVTLDLFSVFRGSPYEIKKIVLNAPDLRLLTLKDGSVNWDIMVPDETPLEETVKAETAPLVLNIRDLVISRGKVLYDDQDLDFVMLLEELEGNVSGDLSTGTSHLMIQAKARKLLMIYENVTYMSGVKANYKGVFEPDLEKDYYTMRDNRINLNDLGIDVDGGFGFIGDDITLDVSFKSKDDDFKSLLSLIPAVYSRDFEKVKTDGKFALSGYVKGLYGDVAMPGFGLDLRVDNASFSYPDLPESIRNIYLKTNIQNTTGDMDDTQVAVDRFDFTIAGNPVKSSLYLKTPVSDPDAKANFSGKIDLTGLSKVVPLDPEETLKGLMEFEAGFVGKLSDVENSRFNLVTASGFLALTGFDYQTSAINLPIGIDQARFEFSPAFLQLSNLEMNIGKSHMQLAGKIENYLAYYLGDGILAGNLNLNSSLIDFNELMAALPAESATTVDTTQSGMQIPDLPERIDFAFNAKAGKILYEKYELKNAMATIYYKDKKIRFEPLRAEMLAGNIEMKGLFDAGDKTSAKIDMDFRISSFDIAQAYSGISMLQQVAPVAEKTKGTFSTVFKLKGILDGEFNPSYETLQGGGTLQTSQILIESVKVMEQLAGLLGNDDYRRLVTDGLNFSFEIINGRVFQKPFSIKYGGTNTTIGGFVGFDKQMNYDLVFQIPYEKFGASQAIKSLSEAALKKGINLNPGSTLNVVAKLSGLVTAPKIELDYKTAAGNIRSELEDAARQELQKQKEEAMKKVSEEAQKILNEARSRGQQLISQAESTASTIRTEATAAAEKVRSEAENQAKRLEDEGKKKGMVAEIAAKEAARKVRKEGDNTAQKLTREAERKAEDLVNQAKKQADDIMSKAQEQVDNL